MVVYCGHSLIQNCNGNHTPTFGVQTTMDYDKMGAPGAFGMLNLDGGNGTPGASEEGDWILHGYDKYLPLGMYRSDPGAKFSSQNVNGALDARVGTVLLFPVFKTLSGHRPERAVRHHRLDRVLPDEGNNARQQRNTRRVFHRIHRPGNPRPERLGSPEHLWSQISSTRRLIQPIAR